MMRCLIIDDEHLSREIAKLVIRRFGFTVDEAENVPDAMAMLRKQKYDLILLDWMMPEIDGIEMLKMLHLTDLRRQFKVVVCSVKEGPQNVSYAMKNGADAYITKPVTEPLMHDVLLELEMV